VYYENYETIFQLLQC